MALDFFTSQQGFNTNLADISSKIGSNNNDAVKRNQINSFKTEESAADNARNKKQFAEFMDSLKKKQNSNNDKNTEQKTDRPDKPNETNSNTKLQDSKSLSAFHTQQSAIDFISLASEEETLPAASLALLSEKLQLLIDEEVNKAERPENGLIQIVEGNDKTNSDKELRSLLASIITQIKSNNNDNNETADNQLQLGDDPLLTAIGGLTPQEITDLKFQINEFLTDELNDENREALASLISQFFPLTKPEAKAEKQVGDSAQTISNNVLKTDLQSKENTLSQNSGQQEQPKESKYDVRYDSRYDISSGRINSESDKTFETALKNISGKDVINNAPTPQNNVADKTSGQRFLQISSALSPIANSIDGASISTTAQTLTPLQSALTNVTTQAQSAAQTHPATQLVSITIQKAVKSGDDTNIKLRLDPPDLGRVEVKMSIDKNNKTKIVLTAEKPETYLMLQRDSQALQQSLGDNGLDNGADISFEMASEDHEFNQQNNNGDSNKNKGSKNDDEQIIQSTMDWYVNPETGRMHYNIVV